jgi:hypothetical protein
MERVVLGEDGTCVECERVLWHGEPAHCGSTRGPECMATGCNGGSECVTVCDACLRRLADLRPMALQPRL